MFLVAIEYIRHISFNKHLFQNLRLFFNFFLCAAGPFHGLPRLSWTTGWKPIEHVLSIARCTRGQWWRPEVLATNGRYQLSLHCPRMHPFTIRLLSGHFTPCRQYCGHNFCSRVQRGLCYLMLAHSDTVLYCETSLSIVASEHDAAFSLNGFGQKITRPLVRWCVYKYQPLWNAACPTSTGGGRYKPYSFNFLFCTFDVQGFCVGITEFFVVVVVDRLEEEEDMFFFQRFVFRKRESKKVIW